MTRRQLRPGFDRNLVVAPFGVMFRDRLDRQVIADGLTVELSELRRPERKQRLDTNRHGVYVAHAVPRMRLPADFDTVSPPVIRRFNLDVSDTLARFVPLRVSVDLPGHGLFQPECLAASPSEHQPHVPLFSASTRSVPAGVAAVRADLRLDSDHERPAAWARLELWLGPTLLAEGVADERGGALLLSPLPAPRDPPLHGSPADGAFERTSWEVTLRAYWDAAIAREPVPNLCTLRRLPEVPVIPDTFVLRSGTPLLARSAGSSFLFVGA